MAMVKKVFILGAGASRELEFDSSTLDIYSEQKSQHSIKGPLSKGFFYSVRECMVEICKLTHLPSFEGKIFDQWLVKFIKEYYEDKNNERIDNIETLFVDKMRSDSINIESLYIAMEDKIRKGDQFVDTEWIIADLGRISFLKYIHNVFSAISYYFYSKFHRILANYIVKHGGDIVSFNWDILIEEELYDNCLWDYWDGYGFEPKGVIDKNKRTKKYRYKQKGIVSRNLVLKPHGSINWYEKISNDLESDFRIYIGMPLTRKDVFRGGTTFNNGQIQFCEYDSQRGDHYRSLIMPPGRKRKSNDFIWDRMKTLLENADEIITIGFSFNDFDIHISEFFKRLNYKETLEIKIVNPDSDIEKRYKEIFESQKVSKIFNNFSEYCFSLVKEKDMEKFSSLISNIEDVN